MTKYTIAFALWLCTLCAGAQQSFTETIQKTVEAAGKIVLYQDKTITDLVNGTLNKPAAAAPTAPKPTHQAGAQHRTDSLVTDSAYHGPKVKMSGFRIQVYFGDNSRRGKADARAAGQKFKNNFPGLPVYVSFVSPHWLCRVGDFQTNDEAAALLQEIREMGIFPEAVIVKSKINVRADVYATEE